MRSPRNDPALSSSPTKGTHQSSTLRGAPTPGSKEPERTCILARRTAPRDQLIRLALGPDGQVAPDIRARAPGRGAWIGVGRKELDEANAKGKLKSALARALKASTLDVPADLGERIEQALRQQALDRLGMEAKAGNLINGADRIEQAARAGKVHLMIHAADAGEDGRKRLDQALRVGARVGGGPSTSLGTGTQGLVFPLGRTILSMALGRENVVHIALTDDAAARRVIHAIARWQAFIDPDAGLERGLSALPAAASKFVNEGNA